MNEQDSKTPKWHNAVAGGVAGAGARCATAPLDLLRIRRQLETNVTYPRPSLWRQMLNIVESEGGAIALFRGGWAGTYLWIGYSGIQFALYAHVQEWFQSLDDSNNPHPTAIAFCSGGTAGVCATLATYPFDICRTIFAARGLPLHSFRAADGVFRPPKSMQEFALGLYRQNGLKTFYAGSGPACIQVIPYMGFSFAIYDRLTRDDRRVGSSGMAGSIAGGVSKMIVYPMDTVKKRLQAQAVFGSDAPYKGMVDCFSTMWRKEGITRFYSGVVPAVLKTTIATGLSFALFRGTKNCLESLHGEWQTDDRKATDNSFEG